jgi:hypothetical protein
MVGTEALFHFSIISTTISDIISLLTHFVKFEVTFWNFLNSNKHNTLFTVGNWFTGSKQYWPMKELFVALRVEGAIVHKKTVLVSTRSNQWMTFVNKVIRNDRETNILTSGKEKKARALNLARRLAGKNTIFVSAHKVSHK